MMDVEKSLGNIRVDWVMVDYNDKKNIILASDDMQKDFNSINKYF